MAGKPAGKPAKKPRKKVIKPASIESGEAVPSPSITPAPSTGPANKSEAIRAAHADNPTLKPKALAEELGKRGVEVTPQMVSTILSQAKKKAGKGPSKRGPKAGKKKGPKAASGPGNTVAANGVGNHLIALLDAVKGVGGAKAAMSILERIEDVK